LKNTETELESQDEMMRAVLTSVCQRFGLVVVGYSVSVQPWHLDQMRVCA
jgi:hypothetical protein